MIYLHGSDARQHQIPGSLSKLPVPASSDLLLVRLPPALPRRGFEAVAYLRERLDHRRYRSVLRLATTPCGPRVPQSFLPRRAFQETLTAKSHDLLQQAVYRLPESRTVPVDEICQPVVAGFAVGHRQGSASWTARVVVLDPSVFLVGAEPR